MSAGANLGASVAARIDFGELETPCYVTDLGALRQNLAILARVLWTCVLRASPRRAWMTMSLMGETLLRRPKALHEAVTFALIHKHLYDYMRDTCRKLDALVAADRGGEPPLPATTAEA